MGRIGSRFLAIPEILSATKTLFGHFDTFLPKNHRMQTVQNDFEFNSCISNLMFLSKYSLDFVFTIRNQPSGETFDKNLRFDIHELTSKSFCRVCIL